MPDVTPTDSIEQLGAEHRAESARAAAEASPADAGAMADALIEAAVPPPPIAESDLRMIIDQPQSVWHNSITVRLAAEVLELRHLAGVIECIKKTGGAVEIHGVRIEPCNSYGETATTRRIVEGGRIAERLDADLLAARDRIAELEDQLREEGNLAGRLTDQLRTACAAGVDARARVDELEKFAADLAVHGLRCDLNPTLLGDGTYEWWSDYLHTADKAIRDRARALLSTGDANA